MLGYVFCAVMIILIGIYFYIYNLSYGYPRFSYSLMSALSIMMFATPLLTMRSFAEERKSRTDQMLLTTPVRIWGGRYNKVTLKKVSKIKCFRSFSQHRNEALSP